MSRLRLGVIVLAATATVLAVLWPGIAGLGVRFGYWGIGHGLGTMTNDWWPYVRYASMALGVLALGLSVFLMPRRITGMAIGAAALALPFAAKMQADAVWAAARSVPAIHDITTDRLDPPMFTAAIMALREASGANPADYVGKIKPGRDGAPDRLVSEIQAEAYPDIVPISSGLSPAEAYAQALKAVKSFGWALVSDDADAGIIEATDTTFWYGFKDDVIIRIRAGEGGGSVIDVRSLSRVGGSDLGKNAARIRAFRDKIEG